MCYYFKMIDLHSHSTASDGLFTPEQAAQYAAEKNLKVWALTDHDTVAGLNEAEKVCRKTGVIFVPGTELNINWPTGEFHLLGLGLQKISAELEEIIDYLTEDRRFRNSQIVELMQKDGIDITLEELEKTSGASQIGRPHFAKFLVQTGKVKRIQDAFDRYLAKGRPWYMPHQGAELKQAVKAIETSGGLPVLAHPLSLYVGWGKIEGVITEIRDLGVKGLEGWHPGARVGEAMRLEEIAHSLGMFCTGGSDFHGIGVRADRHLGKTSGDKKIDDRFYFDELLPALERFR